MPVLDETPLTAEQAELACGYLRLVHWCANRAIRRFPLESYDDLVDDGMIGLLRAARAYEPDSRAKFITFGSLVIQREMARGVERRHRPCRWTDRFPLSLDADTDGVQLADLIPSSVRTDDDVISEQLLAEAVACLPPGWRRIVPTLLGYQTKREAAEALGLSYARVQQLCEKARRRLQVWAIRARVDPEYSDCW